MKHSNESLLPTTMPKILVVEDDTGILAALRICLKMANFDAKFVASDAEALRMLEQDSFDAVLFDLRLSSGRGQSILNALREKSKRIHPPKTWIAMTIDDHHEIVEKFGDIGSRLISKPFDPWEMVNRVNLSLGR